MIFNVKKCEKKVTSISENENFDKFIKGIESLPQTQI